MDTRPGDPGGAKLDATDRARLLQYLDDELAADINLATLAEHVGLTVREFTAAFGAAFHTSPYQFVLDRRIARAKVLLRTTARAITDVATAVGFSTPSHFATTFKNRVGMAPSAYRNGSSAGPHPASSGASSGSVPSGAVSSAVSSGAESAPAGSSPPP